VDPKSINVIARDFMIAMDSTRIYLAFADDRNCPVVGTIVVIWRCSAPEIHQTSSRVQVGGNQICTCRPYSGKEEAEYPGGSHI